MKKNKLFLNKALLLLVTILIFAGVSNSAFAVLDFKEDFSTSTLDPAWQVVQTAPGLGSYSLTANPGNLRYSLTGSRGYSGGWANGYQPNSYWRPSLTLLRQFDGENWVLKTEANYNLHARDPSGSTGAQRQDFWIALGEDTNDYIYIDRGVDYWYGSTSSLTAQLVSNGVSVAIFTGEPIPTGSDGWIRGTYWYEITREGNKITVRYSKDNYSTIITAFSASLSEPVAATQRAIIDMNNWNSVGSYTDWDYINVEQIVPTVLDSDGDGYFSDVDCDDHNAAINPGATEICNNIDDDCDGATDEDLTESTNELGECSINTETCSAGSWIANNEYSPVTETCDNLDNDCDGATDNGEFTQYTGTNVGECQQGITECMDGQMQQTQTEILPQTEICDGKDNDCDGSTTDDGVDETWYQQPTNCGIGECAATGQLICSNGATQNTCTPGLPTLEIPGNNLDENCDSTITCNSLAVWKNHGEYQSCVAQETQTLYKAGLITEGQRSAIVNSAAKSDVGKK